MSKNQNLLVSLLSALAVVAGVLFAAWILFLGPMNRYNRQITEVNLKIRKKRHDLLKIQKEQAAMKRYQFLSLPADVDEAQTEYFRYLADMLHRHYIQVSRFKQKGDPSAKYLQKTNRLAKTKSDPVYRVIPFEIRGTANLTDFANLLIEFHQSPILHRIKHMTIKPDDPDTEDRFPYLVDLTLNIEALIVEGAMARGKNLAGVDERLVGLEVFTALGGGPLGLATIPWMLSPRGPVERAILIKEQSLRDHRQLVKRIEKDNVFIGYIPPPKPKPTPMIEDPRPPEPEPPKGPNMLEWYKLINISKSSDGEDDTAILYTPLHTPNSTMQRVMRPNRTVRILNLTLSEEVLRFKVLRIDYEAVFFKIDEDVYSMRTGQTLAEALESPLPPTELATLKLNGAGAD